MAFLVITVFHASRRRLRALAVCVGLACGVSLPATSAAEDFQEAQVKAVFLFNFAFFVEWPADSFASTDAPFVVGVLGQDPFGAHLDEAVRGEAVAGHPIAVQRFSRVEDIASCHILYISRSEAGRMPAILAQLKGRSILTVTDDAVAAGGNGMIRFVTVQNRVRLRINIDAAKAARLTLSSKLLRPAEIVTDARNGG